MDGITKFEKFVKQNIELCKEKNIKPADHICLSLTDLKCILKNWRFARQCEKWAKEHREKLKEELQAEKWGWLKDKASLSLVETLNMNLKMENETLKQENDRSCKALEKGSIKPSHRSLEYHPAFIERDSNLVQVKFG